MRLAGLYCFLAYNPPPDLQFQFGRNRNIWLGVEGPPEEPDDGWGGDDVVVAVLSSDEDDDEDDVQDEEYQCVQCVLSLGGTTRTPVQIY